MHNERERERAIYIYIYKECMWHRLVKGHIRPLRPVFNILESTAYEIEGSRVSGGTEGSSLRG